MMKFLGIDTDTKGSIALIDSAANTLTVYKMPAHMVEISDSDKLRVDKPALANLMLRLITSHRPDVIVYEQQWARPATGVGKDGKVKKTQGIASTFTFAEAYGAIQGSVYSAVAHVQSTDDAYVPRIEPVTGKKWKSGFKLPADKPAAVALATSFFPACAGYWELSKNVSAAEATLIALYGAIIFAKHDVNVTKLTPLDLGIMGFTPICLTSKSPRRKAPRRGKNGGTDQTEGSTTHPSG